MTNTHPHYQMKNGAWKSPKHKVSLEHGWFKRDVACLESLCNRLGINNTLRLSLSMELVCIEEKHFQTLSSQG